MPIKPRFQKIVAAYYFEEGYVQILADTKTPTEEVLSMVETLIDLKRKELQMLVGGKP